MLQGLRTVIYGVADLPRAKQWYAAAFGVQPYFDQAFYVGFNIGGYELGLDPNAAVAVGAGVVAYWGVENIQQEFDRLLQLGATSHSAVRDVGGDIQVASVVDPFGNILGIIYNPHFKLTDR